MNTRQVVVARGHQIVQEVRKGPWGAGIAVGAGIILIGLALGQDLGWSVVVGIATTVVIAVVLSVAHSLDRQIRNGADTTVIARLVGSHLPALGTWAIEGDFGQLISQEVQRGPTTNIVECGSGVSTLVIAAQLCLKGVGRLYTIEHDPRYAEETARRLVDAGLDKWVCMIVAPTVRQTLGTETIRWYDLAQVEPQLPEAIHLLIVDGPPSTYPWARWPAVKALYGRMPVGGVVLADDGRTRYERKTAFRWQAEHDDVELYWQDTVKGTWRLVKLAGARPDGPITDSIRLVRRILNPRPQGFGRWPIRR